MDFNLNAFRSVSQSRQNSRIGSGQIAAPRQNRQHLPERPADDHDASPHGGYPREGLELKTDKSPFRLSLIGQERQGAVEVSDREVEIAIVVEVGRRNRAPQTELGKIAAGRVGDVGKNSARVLQ